MTAVDMPVLQLGAWLLHPQQARTYLQWANASHLMQCDCSITLGNGGCTTSTTWTNPVSDSAPWVDASASESARFLGVFVTRIEGLDDPVISRSMTNRVGGGGVAGASTVGPRGLRIEGLLLATDAAALEWGKRWWSRRWDRPADWSTLAGCSGAQISVRGHCDQPWFDLFEVIAPNGPEWSETQCCGTVVAFTLDLSAGSPWLWEQPVIVNSGTLGDGGATACGCGAIILGGGFDAPFSECPACASCDTVDDCLVDPHVTVVAEPTWVAGATEFDNEGRPNCGTGSAYYASGVETVWTDPDGRGATNGHYLDTPQEAPHTDHYGAPSCGSGSAIFGAYPAGAAATVTLHTSSQVVAQWAAQQVAVSSLTPTQLVHLTASITPAGGALVRNVTRQLVWRNTNASPQVLAGSALTQVRPAPTGTAVTLDGGVTTPPVGWVADVVIGWEQLVPSGSVTVTATTPATGPIKSLNGGTFPAYDAIGRPSCGPGSEHYGDEIPVRDPQGRPSCGDGSALYGLETPVYDAANRPSCGTGSAHYNDQIVYTDWDARVSCGTGSAQWLHLPAFAALDQTLVTASGAEGVLDGAAGGTTFRVPAAAWNQGKFTATGTNAGIALHRIAVGYYTKTGLHFAELFNSGCRYPECTGGFTTGDRALPQLPPDAVVVVTISLEWQTTYGVGGGSSATSLHFPAADELVSPNGGTDSTCTVGPNAGTDRACNPPSNGGVDRPCVIGPNAGAVGQCGGVDRACAALVPGPNAGADRERVVECVTSSSLPWTEFAGGWDIPAPVNGALPHPGDTSSMRALLEAAEGASVPGLTSPLGAYLFRLRHLPVSTGGSSGHSLSGALVSTVSMPAASRILAVRLVLKFTPPTGSQTSTTWPGWTLQARSGGTARGGWVNTTGTPKADDDGFTRVALDVRNPTELAALVLYGQLAAPTGGVAGKLDYAAVEVQWVNSGSKFACGPNGGTDRPCPGPSVSAGIPGWADPADPVVRCETIIPPANADAVSVLTFTAPAGQDVRSITVKWYANPTGLPCPSAAAAAWACTAPIATALIPRIPAGTTLTISGAGERVTVTCDGVERDASALIYGPDGPFRWPVLTGRTCVCITADSCSGATAAAGYSTGYATRHSR